MFRSLFFASVVLLGVVPATAQNLVSNVKSAQVPGTHTVEITYDLSASASCTISVQASEDAGANYRLTLPADALSGDVGAKYYNAGTRTIVLDASKVDQLKSTFTKDLRFKVVASGVAVLGQMVLIPAGTFQMGNSFAGEGHSDEVPVHSVTVSAFYLQNTEVTNDQMVEVLNWAYGQGKLVVTTTTVKNAAGNQQELVDLDSSRCRILWNTTLNSFEIKAAKGSGYPCVEVTWYGSAAWCNYRSEMDGFTPCYSFTDWSCNWNTSGYRLPTEAEWERAARGGQSGKRFPWGDTITHSLANYYSSTSYAYDVSPTRGYHPTYNDGVIPYTSPVGSFPPTGEWQLYDMTGNLWEWCWDWYSGSYYTSSPMTNPRGHVWGSLRVVRGGRWSYSANDCRTADRGIGFPGYTGNFSSAGVGFRPARSSVP